MPPGDGVGAHRVWCRLRASWQCWGEDPGDSWSSAPTSEPESHSAAPWLERNSQWANSTAGCLSARRLDGIAAGQTSSDQCPCVCERYILCLTFQHFHSHLGAGMRVSKTVGRCLHHPTKGSRAKSATWSTKRGSVRRRPWMQHVVVWEVNGEAQQKQKLLF